MWMARQQGQEFLQESAANCGQVTVDGPELAVALAGERRQVGRWLPGGYHWSPRRGDTVLVVKSGAEGSPCLVGMQDETVLEPGEVVISTAQGTGIHLKPDGRILLKGTVEVEGTLTVNGQEV